MPAGIKYETSPIEKVREEAARFDTCYRLSGGFNLSDDKLVAGTWLPSLAPLCVNFTTRKAVAVKCVEVAEAYTSTATSLKIKKGSLVYKEMFIGNGSKGAQVSAIDTTSADYDVLTLAAALGATLAVGAVLFEASAVGGTAQKNKANFLNYADVKVQDGATVAAIGQLYEIRTSALALPVSDKDKESLGARFLFI